MYRKFLVALEHDKIVAVALVIPEEKVLAMDGIDILPILQGKFYRRQRRMCVKLKAEAVLFKKEQHLVYAWVVCHLLRLFA